MSTSKPGTVTLATSIPSSPDCSRGFAAAHTALAGGLVLFGGLIFGSCTTDPVARDDLQRDVVLIVLDTLRADHVGVYGSAPYPATPALDQFARQGVWFDSAWASSSWTPPSVMSLMTSLRPAVHGLEQDGERMGLAPPLPAPGAITLAEILRAAGYQTMAVTAGGGVGRGYGFDRGFDRFLEPAVIPPDTVETGVDTALTWVEQANSRPLFLFFHTYEVHLPNTHQVFQGGPSASEQAVAAYASDLAVADHHIGRLLEGLERLRGLDRAVVVVTSDHGENLHDRPIGPRPVDHGHLHRELLEVPLVVVAPGLVPPRGAIAGAVMLLDVVPTVLALVGVDHTGLTLQGRDLRPQLEERVARTAERELSAGAPLQGPTWDALRTREWALLRAPAISSQQWWAEVRPPSIALFDRIQDPTERHNVAADHPELVARLSRRLDQLRRADLELHRTLGGAATSDASLVEDLRSLGYLDLPATDPNPP